MLFKSTFSGNGVVEVKESEGQCRGRLQEQGGHHLDELAVHGERGLGAGPRAHARRDQLLEVNSIGNVGLKNNLISG